MIGLEMGDQTFRVLERPNWPRVYERDRERHGLLYVAQKKEKQCRSKRKTSGDKKGFPRKFKDEST